MAKKNSPISYLRGQGLMVSTKSTFPESTEDKIIVAKSIVQAALAAYDNGNLADENYDIHWPLSMAIDLLERAAEQLGVQHG